MIHCLHQERHHECFEIFLVVVKLLYFMTSFPQGCNCFVHHMLHTNRGVDEVLKLEMLTVNRLITPIFKRGVFSAWCWTSSFQGRGGIKGSIWLNNWSFCRAFSTLMQSSMHLASGPTQP